MIIAVMRLKDTARTGGKLAKWAILWYVLTTFFALIPTVLIVAFGWARLYEPVGLEQLAVSAADQATIDQRASVQIHESVVNLFDSFVSNNIVNSLATNALLAVIIIAIIMGCLIVSSTARIRLSMCRV